MVITPDKLMKSTESVVSILKKRFNNMSTEETIKLSHEIVKVVIMELTEE